MKKKIFSERNSLPLYLSFIISLSSLTNCTLSAMVSSSQPSLQEQLVDEIRNRGELNKVKELLEARASIHYTDEKGSTLLHLAAMFNRVAIATLLIEKGASVNALNQQDGSTPLHEAAYHGNTDSVKLLLNHNADISLRDHRGETPLQQAQQKTTSILLNFYHKETLNFYKKFLSRT